jgi:LysR family hydrogen peroxide-inducible transcriptional activator
MELQQIRYALELARQRNFTRAARACHVSQPTLSQQLRKLEEELGEPLFKRLRAGAVPTPFGERFLARARRIHAELENVRGDAGALRKEVVGDLTVGAIPTIAPYLLPGWIERFTGAHPRVRLAIREETTDVLVRQLLDGSVDLAVLSPGFAGEEQTERRIVLRDELLVTLPRDHRLALLETIPVKELREAPLMLLKEEHCLSRQSLVICGLSGHEPQVAINSSQLETVLALVEAGFGISFTPSIAVPFLAKRKVTYRSLAPERTFREIAIAWPRDVSLTRAESAFLDCVASAAPRAAGT